MWRPLIATALGTPLPPSISLAAASDIELREKIVTTGGSKQRLPKEGTSGQGFGSLKEEEAGEDACGEEQTP